MDQSRPEKAFIKAQYVKNMPNVNITSGESVPSAYCVTVTPPRAAFDVPHGQKKESTAAL